MQPYLLPPIAAAIILALIYCARRYSRHQEANLLREAAEWRDGR